MKQIQNNPYLSAHSVEDKIRTPFNTLTVPPCLELTAVKVSEWSIGTFKFELDGEKLTIEEAMEKNLFDFKVVIEPKLKDTEWILITEEEIYHSSGDNSESINK